VYTRAAIFVALSALTIAASAQDWSTAFVNGNIYTGNPAHPHATSIFVNNGRIVAIDAPLGSPRPTQHVIDLHGATAVPGLTDAHCHLGEVGEREVTLNLEGTQSLADFLAKVKERIAVTPKDQWVTGRGWIETPWHPQTFPTRFDLDAISDGHPIYLTRADGHGAIANSIALKLAGITKDTPNPFGGEIMKDPKTGEPNGMLLDSANAFIAKLLPQPSREDIEKFLLKGVERTLRMGLCEVHIPGNSLQEIQAIERLYEGGQIKIRIYDAMMNFAAQPKPRIKTHRHLIVHVGKDQYDHHFTLNGMKFYADGALGSKGAALLSPYSDYNSSGFMSLKKEEVLPVWEECLRDGTQVWTHAIGDRANRTVLDWYEEAMKAVPKSEWKVKDPRWRIEHAQIVSDEDVPRFHALGVIPSMQPSHAIGDLHFAGSRLGMDRLKEGYRWADFIKAGSIISGGSDAPVEQGNPMIEFYAAVARKDLKGYSGPGWHPEQAVSRETALKMFTIWAAYAAFEEDSRGTLEVGKLADMTVLSADIMKIPVEQIPTTHALKTIVGGEVVYEASRRR
jgi:predicted amidohydrolase YtcJ